MGARYRGGIGLSYRAARPQAREIHSLESIPGLHKSLEIRALNIEDTLVTFLCWEEGGGMSASARLRVCFPCKPHDLPVTFDTSGARPVST